MGHKKRIQLRQPVLGFAAGDIPGGQPPRLIAADDLQRVFFRAGYTMAMTPEMVGRIAEQALHMAGGDLMKTFAEYSAKRDATPGGLTRRDLVAALRVLAGQMLQADKQDLRGAMQALQDIVDLKRMRMKTTSLTDSRIQMMATLYGPLDEHNRE